MSNTRSFAAIVIIFMCFTKTISRPQLTRFGRSRGSLVHAGIISTQIPEYRSLHSLQEKKEAIFNLKEKRQDAAKRSLNSVIIKRMVLRYLRNWRHHLDKVDNFKRIYSLRRIQFLDKKKDQGNSGNLRANLLAGIFFFGCRVIEESHEVFLPSTIKNYDDILRHRRGCQSILI